MRRISKTRLSFLGAVALAALAGCNNSPQSNANSGATPPAGGGDSKTVAQSGGKDNKPIRAALVLDKGGRDDRSFNAAAFEGIERAQKELHIEERYIESKDASDYKTNLTQFASEGYDLVFAVGFAMEDALKEVAPQFPNVKFVIVDGNAPDLPNCAALQFREEQGTFLAGFLAASMSKTKTIGFVGGMDIPLIKKFEAGYRAGAKTADPKVQIKSAYTNDWDDQNKGASVARQIFGNGADIVFHAAGKGGLGVIQVAKEKGPGFYAIGVDRDQDDEAPGRVLTSMVKRLDNAVFDTCKRVKEGQFAPGTHRYDLKEGGIGLSEMKFTKKDIPADVLARLDKLTKMVADGQIVPPTTLEEAETFQPPKF